MIGNSENTVGKLAPTPEEIQTRFRQLSGSNVAYPKYIDANYPSATVLDIGREVRETIFLRLEATATAASGTVQLSIGVEDDLFQKMRKANFIEFKTVGFGGLISGTGNFSVQAYIRTVNEASTTVDLVLGSIEDYNTGRLQTVIELLPFTKRFDLYGVTAYDDGSNDTSIQNMTQININWNRWNGAGTIQPICGVAVDLIY